MIFIKPFVWVDLDHSRTPNGVPLADLPHCTSAVWHSYSQSFSWDDYNGNYIMREPGELAQAMLANNDGSTGHTLEGTCSRRW